MAGWSGYGVHSYSGHMACHENDGAGSNAASPQGGVTASYVVQPNGWGGYLGGELILNASALWGNNPCVFSLETSGEGASSYTVDWSGVAYETLNWVDDNADACATDTFTHYIEAALSIPNSYGVANQTKTTSNIDITYDSDEYSFAGSGDCVSSAH